MTGIPFPDWFDWQHTCVHVDDHMQGQTKIVEISCRQYGTKLAGVSIYREGELWTVECMNTAGTPTYFAMSGTETLAAFGVLKTVDSLDADIRDHFGATHAAAGKFLRQHVSGGKGQVDFLTMPGPRSTEDCRWHEFAVSVLVNDTVRDAVRDLVSGPA